MAEDIDDILYNGTKDQILGIHCPNCGGIIRYSFTYYGKRESRFTTECLNCHAITIEYNGPEPNCVKYFGKKYILRNSDANR